jgi:hypothetical protein
MNLPATGCHLSHAVAGAAPSFAPREGGAVYFLEE